MSSNTSPYHPQQSQFQQSQPKVQTQPQRSSLLLSKSTSSSPKSFSKRIQKFDFQNKIPTEFRVYTTQGAILSTITILILFYLLSTEYKYNLTSTTNEKVYVNTTSNQLIDVEIDITFPSIPCALLSFDAMDPNHQRQSLHLDTKHKVWKHRMDSNGKMIGRKSRFEMGMTLKNEEHIHSYAKEKKIQFVNDRKKKEKGDGDGGIDDDDDAYYNDDDFACGSCYGAGLEDECCNTCDDVKRAYQRKGWVFAPNLDVKQCHNSPNSNDQIGEGCNIHGYVSLASSGGDLHIAPGHELENFGKQVMFKDLNDLLHQAFDTFNVSHVINKLRFGNVEYPGSVHQLDGEERIVDDVYGMYQYYFQIVPTEFKFLNGTIIQTNQYSVIEHLRHVRPGMDRGLPGVYFFYEVSPLHVRIEEYKRGWVQFFTSVAAVIGGIFSAMKMMDAYIFSKTANGNTGLKF